MPSEGAATRAAARALAIAAPCVFGLLAAAGLAWAQAAPPGAPPPTRRVLVLDRIVAVVDERPLLLSDVGALARLRGIGLEEAREAAIDERLMYAEASRVAQPSAEVSQQDEDAALAALLDKTPLVRAAVSVPDLRRLVRRQIAILRYVEFRFRPQIQVSDEDVRRAWENEEVEGASGLALEDAQAAIRESLERRQLDRRLEAWIEELKARADVRYVGEPLPRVLPPLEPSATPEG